MKKVLLGMSGGVDSAVSAILLKEQGYEVIGATMVLCESGSDLNCKDAKSLCDKLNIEHYVLDFRKEFEEHVIKDFVSCYENCITPNPCIECNKYLKFDKLYQKAKELGCEYIATGHYAKTQFVDKYGKIMITKSKSIKKDQSYVLWNISKDILDKIVFPLGDFETKDEIRKLASENGIEFAQKPDSQEICFIPDNNYAGFIEKYSDKKFAEGNIVDVEGNVLGKHKGLIHYTVGQRKGMGIAYKEPLFVLKLDKEKNELVVGTEKDTYKDELNANELNFFVDDIPTNIKAKIRYSAKEENAILTIKDGVANVKFENMQRHITPGQSVVFYDGDVVIGGGKIF